MGTAVLNITVGIVVLLVLLVVHMHSDDVLLACLYSDLLDCEGYVPLKESWIDWCKRCTVLFLWFRGWCDLLGLGVLSMTDELFPGIIILAWGSVVMASGFAMASVHIVFTICVREVAGGGLVCRHVCSERRDGKVIASDGVRRDT